MNVESSRARRMVLVPAARTLPACISRRRSPKRDRQSMARLRASGEISPFSESPSARRTVSRIRSRIASWPWRSSPTIMWKLFEPRSTAAIISGWAVSDGEGRSAAAGGLCIRIPDDELRSLQVFLVIDLGAHEVLNAHRVNQQRNTAVFDLAIAVLDVLIERKPVLESRAPAARNKYAQLEIRVVFFRDQLTNLARCRIGKHDAIRDLGSALCCCCHSSLM